MARLAIILDGRVLVDEAYEDGSGAEHGIYRTCKQSSTKWFARTLC
jgi:hypothetical protein